MKLLITVLLSVLVCPAFCLSTTYYVPDDFPTIQASLISLNTYHGDTIIVRPGTYNERINFFGKNVTLKSEQGPSMTVIRGNRNGALVAMVSGETSDCVLEGFTLTNGEDIWGGGVYVAFSTPVIKGNIITENYANRGAGIYLNNANAYVASNSIAMNVASKRQYSEAQGGGVHILDSSPALFYNIIKENQIDEGVGGGIYCQGGSALMKFNVIDDNEVLDGNGGGLYSDQCAFVLRNNFLSGNKSIYGGALFINDSNATLMNNMITRNFANRGGGIWCQEQDLELMNCTVAANLTYENAGGGIWCTSTSIITNCIIWSNIGSNHYGSSSAQINYSNIEEEWTGEGNLYTHPQFINPAGGNYHLSRESACINMGTFDGAPDDDVDGDVRPRMGGIDIGADEFDGIHTLSADSYEVTASAADTVQFALKARTTDAGREYLMLGSTSGMTPGYTLPNGLVLPVNPDLFMVNIVFPLLNSYTFTDFMGTLDASGNAVAVLHTPVMNPSYVGTVMYYAYVVGLPYDFASNGVPIEIVP